MLITPSTGMWSPPTVNAFSIVSKIGKPCFLDWPGEVAFRELVDVQRNQLESGPRPAVLLPAVEDLTQEHVGVEAVFIGRDHGGDRLRLDGAARDGRRRETTKQGPRRSHLHEVSARRRADLLHQAGSIRRGSGGSLQDAEKHFSRSATCRAVRSRRVERVRTRPWVNGPRFPPNRVEIEPEPAVRFGTLGSISIDGESRRKPHVPPRHRRVLTTCTVHLRRRLVVQPPQ